MWQNINNWSILDQTIGQNKTDVNYAALETFHRFDIFQNMKLGGK